MLILLDGPVFADIAECDEYGDVAFTVPSDGQEGVPVDVRPQIALKGNICEESNESPRFNRARLLDAQGNELARVFIETFPDLPLITLVPDEPLVPFSTFTVVLDVDHGDPRSFTFMTGDEPSSGIDGVPSANVDRIEGEYDLYFDVVPAEAPDGSLLLVHFETFTANVADGRNGPIHDMLVRDYNPSKCYTVDQIGIAGDVATTEACSASGCATTAGSPEWLLAMSAWIGMVVRRRAD